MGFIAKTTGAYLRTSVEALQNARAICDVLMPRGWTLEAISGLLGNVESESGYNPWRWQSDIVLPYGDSRITYQNAHAYGLCQWDPAGKYILNGGSLYAGYGPNYSDQDGLVTDGAAQMAFLDENADYIVTSSYPLTYAQYKAATISNYTIDYLTRTWFYNFERGTWDNNRVTAATYWYQTLSGYQPHGVIPIWLLFKFKGR